MLHQKMLIKALLTAFKDCLVETEQVLCQFMKLIFGFIPGLQKLFISSFHLYSEIPHELWSVVNDY